EISSRESPEKIKKKREKGNEKIFEGIPGIGKKKARKIILELSGKLQAFSPIKKEEIKDDEAFLALINLGFKKEEVKKAFSQLPKNIKDPQEKIKQALKFLGR
ncbi:MAG: hypothetical protein DRH33_01080, partial [Candidatus Nealsonbacteria bacterium]